MKNLNLESTSLINILSYPRSGNHLVRTILESISGKETLGVIGGRQTDQPIYRRKENRKTLGFKQHFVEEIGLDELGDYQTADRLLVIVRNPFEAITSHCYKHIALMTNPSIVDWVKIKHKKRIRKLTAPHKLISYPESIKSSIWNSKYQSLEEFIGFNIIHWCSIVECYHEWDDQKKCIIKLENLTSISTRRETIERISGFLTKCGHYSDTKLSEQDFNQIFNDASNALIRKIDSNQNRLAYKQDILRIYLSMKSFNKKLIPQAAQEYINNNYLSAE